MTGASKCSHHLNRHKGRSNRLLHGWPLPFLSGYHLGHWENTSYEEHHPRICSQMHRCNALAGMGLSASPNIILHSFSSGRSMHGTSTGFNGKFGTSQRILDVNATLYPPGTLAPSVIVVDIKSLIDLWNSFSTSFYLRGSTAWATLSCGKLRLGAVLLHKGPVSLGPLMEDTGRDLLFYLPHICCGVSTLDLIHH